VIKKFDTGFGTADDPIANSDRPNALSSPAPVDVNGDFIVDYFYAGDLFGNVWKIDVTSTSAGDWNFAFDTGDPASDTNKTPFFVAKNAAGTRLPITTRPEVGLHPTLAGKIVYFGTGKYIEFADDTAIGQDTQAFFAVWDRNETGTPSQIERGHLEPQSITEELPFSGSGPDNVRRTTSYNFAWFTGTGLPTQNLSPTTADSDPGRLGWFMDLYSKEGGNSNNYGERMVSNPVLRDGKIIFVTLLPLDDPCLFGGDSWLMELSAATGSRLETSPFDLNGDGVFDINDEIATVDGGGTEPVGGVKSTVGIMPAPGILRDDTSDTPREFKYFSGSSGNIQKVTEDRGTSLIGRQSWREIYND
jgi:type IV pilus assembly protein PilY1